MSASIYPTDSRAHDASHAAGYVASRASDAMHVARSERAALGNRFDSTAAWVAIDLGAVRYNAQLLRARADVPLVAMLKADGYGLGAKQLARALGSTLWGIGVATVQEAAELRAAGCTERLLCCTPLGRNEFRDAYGLALRPSLHTSDDICAWAAFGNAPWHLSIDTGIARAGVRWNEVAPLRDAVRVHPPEGMFTHFHSADGDDGSRERQEQRFAEARHTLADSLPASLLIHTDNSSAIMARAPSIGHLARPGIALFGALGRETLRLQQVVHLRARVVDLRNVETGESVGYGASWTAPTARRIATVAAGYGDGYRRSFSNKGVGLLNGARCPVVGRVSMDMTLLDVTDVPCERGDIITLLGTDVPTNVPLHTPVAITSTLTTDDVAALGDLSPYELLVGLRLRLPRIYFDVSALEASALETSTPISI